MTEATNAGSVVIVSDAEDKQRCLIQAVESAGLREALAARLLDADASAAELAIFIKPDLAFFFRPATTITDPALVEGLIDWFHDAGYANVRVGTSRDGTESWLENRDPLILADQAGYRFETPQGRPYEVVDLSDDLVDGGFGDGSVLEGSQLSRAWVEAGFRVSFGKCKSDDQYVYAGALQNLLEVLPLRDKQLHYQHCLRAEDAVGDLLHTTPVHFSIVDAYVANQGNAGSRASNPVYASTVIASVNPLLADWATALKMGVDPYASPIVARALRSLGLPERPRIVGDLSPFPSFRNVDPMVVDAVNKRNAALEVQRAATAWLQTVDRQLFPFKDQLTDRLNQLLAFQFGNLDSNPGAYAAFLVLNYSLGAVNQTIEGTRIMLAKDQLHWIERPLNLPLATYTTADFEQSKTYMESLEELVVQLPPDKNGLRWRYLDNSVLFECSRALPIPFDDFVQRVDIARSIRMMNDYIGGACVPVSRDEAGRITHQAERNLYLPQPNYIVFTGGQPIDVSKLEYITYSESQQKIFWRTILSENNTGKFDDGTVAFTRTGEGTLITVVARQEFILPPFWQLLKLDLQPILKDYLVTDAYRNFFTRTIANFEAVFEGRAYRAGRAWPGAAGDAPAPALPSERLGKDMQRLAGSVREAIDRVTNRLSFRTERPAPAYVDEQGFAHFEPPQAGGSEAQESKPPGSLASLESLGSTAAGFVKDLFEAVSRDLTEGREKSSEERPDAGTGHGR